MNLFLGKIVTVGVAILTLATPSLHALVIRVYDPDRHDRFLNFPSAPTHNPTFLHASLDLTGVGWYEVGNPIQRRGLTMVSPIHFVGANHAQPGIGVIVYFLSTDGQLKSSPVASKTSVTNDSNIPSDLFIGKINTAISTSDKVAFHPYLNLSSNNRYLNRDVIVLGRDALGGSQQTTAIRSKSATSNTIIINSTEMIEMIYDNASGNDDDAYLSIGDSGSPVLYNQNGVAAIIGTNSLRTGSTSTSEQRLYANFIPHYVSKLNAIMELDGYHMTKAIPGSTTMTLNHQLPVLPVRAGHPFTINLTLNNTGSTLGENVKLTNSFPTGTSVTSATGIGWFDESSATVTQARKASLANGNSSNYSITLNIPTPGTAQHQVTYSCDQFPLATENFKLDVIESFVSWTSSLTDSSSGGDDDNDSIGNLLEYAFGGDPESSSQLHPNTTISLLPHHTANSISYIRRTDRVARALTYQLKTSTTLEVGTWLDAGALVSETTVTAIDADFEQVTLDLTAAGTERFFRVEVTLSE